LGSKSKTRKARLPVGSHEIEIDSLSHDGRGVGRLASKAVFLHGALPGEHVRFEYVATHRSYDEGRTVEVLRASPQRVTPLCAHFEQCGGCSMQHLAPAAQIAFKQSQLLEDCRRIGKVEPAEILPPLQADVWGYRHKARLGVRYVEKKGRVLIGFREKRSAFITDIARCEVLHPAIGGRIRLLEELVMSLSIRTAVPQIEVAAGEGKQVLVFRVLQNLSDDDRARLLAFGREQNLAIYVQPQGPDSIYPLYDATEADGLYYYIPGATHDLRIDFKPQDFTQVHPAVNRLIIHQALLQLALRPQERVLDLFCGLGNFTIPMAQQAAYVTGIEGAADMVARARENARRNGVSNIEFHVADLFAPVPQAAWLQQPVDKVLLDPPRAGAQEILPLIGRLEPRRIVYISCNPATLARDAGILVQEWGYRLTHAGVMDMFPHTAHVESMAVFDRS
jgi:23S rRNA (uracil1939-C5)-methyltransferase